MRYRRIGPPSARAAYLSARQSGVKEHPNLIKISSRCATETRSGGIAFGPKIAGRAGMSMPHDLDWPERFPQRVTTAEEAVRSITPGTRILVGSGAAEPSSLVLALCQASHLKKNEVVHLLTLGPALYCAPDVCERLRHTAFSSATTRAPPSGKVGRTSCPSSSPRSPPSSAVAEWLSTWRSCR
jgi:hypothetical protein